MKKEQRELVAFNNNADEYLRAARIIGLKPRATLEMDLEMLEAVIALEVKRTLLKLAEKWEREAAKPMMRDGSPAFTRLVAASELRAAIGVKP